MLRNGIFVYKKRNNRMGICGSFSRLVMTHEFLNGGERKEKPVTMMHSHT
jgi:hypothetical protein